MNGREEHQAKEEMDELRRAIDAFLHDPPLLVRKGTLEALRDASAGLQATSDDVTGWWD